MQRLRVAVYRDYSGELDEETGIEPLVHLCTACGDTDNYDFVNFLGPGNHCDYCDFAEDG